MNSENYLFCLKIIAVLGAVVIMLYGLNRIYTRLKAKDQGFGSNSIRAIGIVLFLPILLMLALLTELAIDSLSVLLGTVAGYVLSNSKSDDNRDS